MSFTFKKIDHVQLAAPKESEELARQFYSDILGFKEIEKPETLRKRGGAWFSIGEIQLHIGTEDPFVPARKAHPALEVENLEAFKQYLSGREIEYIIDHNLPGANRIYLHDPFGNRIELLEWES
ncbi:glyoxalase [Virgibacillus soli]|uniref:VOC family protein n=1 Tax=Lederbergia galactosidilytica TaxID=217031 RepID=UPI0007153FBF|nr:VOC family protein [Lederbergia galactosidilytica]KRG16175.1 glyoxalase [Virgibacillus soli]MBP1914039.1 catechol 2,3-dioxygenase-like lactoylglutathione lyase family enzyme [Lederbergia galactosidilytica]